MPALMVRRYVTEDYLPFCCPAILRFKNRAQPLHLLLPERFCQKLSVIVDIFIGFILIAVKNDEKAFPDLEGIIGLPGRSREIIHPAYCIASSHLMVTSCHIQRGLPFQSLGCSLEETSGYLFVAGQGIHHIAVEHHKIQITSS